MTIIKKFDPDKKDTRQKFPKKYVVLGGITLFILILIEIWVSNTMVSFGEKLVSINNLKNTIKLENQILQNEIAKYSSLTNVATESSKLGFSKPESIQYIR
ncbi:hypothetical protein HYS94_00530 [Candidatus Daviesbacteria bacterium]|nr:hypothetical protein [Candidatus Daviesbacteria bacterium]